MTDKRFRGWDVDRTWLLPPLLHDFVPAGHSAHLVRDAVRETLDLSAILEAYEGTRGQPSYHPAMMMALLLYACSCGVYSSRRIAKGCEERLDFMAVSGLQQPDFRTISDFRKRHLEALGGLFDQVPRLCREAGLARLGHVALDGTKIKANASKHKAMSYGRMVAAEVSLEAEIAAWLERAGQMDAAEDVARGRERRGDETPSWVADRGKRLARIREAKAILEAKAEAEAEAKANAKVAAGKGTGAARDPEPRPPDKAQRNFTDPESRILKTADGFVQGDNAQAAVDADHQVIVAHGLTEEGGDWKRLAPMIEAIERTAGRLPDELSADAGYCSENNLELQESRAVRGYVATGRQKHGTAMATNGRAAGQPQGGDDTVLEAGGTAQPLRLRKITVEPVFGQIKQARGFRQFLLCGRERTGHEWALVCIAHNFNELAAAKA